MVSGKVIQKCIEELKEASKTDFAVAEPDGNIVASTMDETVSPVSIRSFIDSSASFQDVSGKYYFRVSDNDALYFVVICAGDADRCHLMGRVIISELKALTEAYSEHLDKNSFFQNLLLDNLLLVDIYNKAKQLHIREKAPRAVFVIEPKKRSHSNSNDTNDALDVIRSLFSSSPEDFVTSVDEDSVILIKILEGPDHKAEIAETSMMLKDMMNTEAVTGVYVAAGSVAETITDISGSYKEAKMTLSVGKLFYEEKEIFSYDTLGIGRLIYQLPTNLCRMFLHEIFGPDIPTHIDEETLTTINTFLENNLNVSETSRQLYVHRNTLVYRIEKIARATGLDIRNFDDALTLKIAIMVLYYTRNAEKTEQ